MQRPLPTEAYNGEGPPEDLDHATNEPPLSDPPGYTLNDHLVSKVGKKWETRNPVPGPFSAKIRKVNQNSESRREFGK